MLRIPFQGDAFIFAHPPLAESGDLESMLRGRMNGGPLPDLFYWDGEGDVVGGRVHFGRGGLDPLLAAACDLSGCAAVREGALQAMQADQKAVSPAQAITVLSRSPATRSIWCPGLTGRLPPRDGQAPTGAQRGAHIESVSIALLIDQPDLAVEPFFAALREQVIDARAEVVVVVAGMSARQVKALSQSLEACGAADGRLRIRRYNLSGTVPRPYLVNTAVALATGESVVIADPRCVPRSPHLIQALAAWAAGSDVATASPRIEKDGSVVCAGLGLVERDGASRIAMDASGLFHDALRLTAAPSPYLFALRRNAWLACGGIAHSGDDLWTAGLAGTEGPRGRHILVGTELAAWVGGERPALLSSPAPSPLRPSAGMALRPSRLESDSFVTRAASASSGAGLNPAALPLPPLASAFSDPFPSSAELRALVIADAFGASQAIAFQHGLACARRDGSAAVHLVEEAAFPKDVQAVRAQVRAVFAKVQPTVVVVSRLGAQHIWRAVKEEARRSGPLLVFHIDDDLLNLPVTLGIERYRVARHPRRVQTYSECLAECDVTLAATDELASRLVTMAGHRRIAVMGRGSAGSPPAIRPRRSDATRVRIGYMGSASHNHDLTMIMPSLNRVLAAYDHVEFVLFGSIASQPAARLLKGRVAIHKGVVADYSAFKRRLAELEFDIGLAPLRDIDFNRCKTPTKWVELAEAGAACLVSDLEPYRPMLRAEAALGVREHGWELGLRRLIEDGALRERLVRRSDELLRRDYAWAQLERSIIRILKDDVNGRMAA